MTDRLARHLLAQGFTLFAAGLAAGLTVPLAANPRTVLAAHVIGLTTGLAALATAWALPQLRLGLGAARLIVALIVVSFWVGLLAQWAGGLLDLSRMFVVTAAGEPEGAPWAERLVELLTKAITPVTLLPFLLLAAAAWRTALERARAASLQTGRRPV